MEQDQDYLVDVTGSNYRLISASGPAQQPVKTPSFNNLVQELFNASSPAAMEVDLARDFADDCEKSTEPEQEQQSITSMACTLEYPTVQVTQRPQVLYPQREGATRESVPHLPGEVLPRTVPALPVFFRVGDQPQQPQPQLHQLDINELDELLSPNSMHSSGTEMPQVETAKPATQSVDDATPQAETESHIEDFELNRRIKFIQQAIEQYHCSGAAVSSNGKVQVHEVVLVLLLAEQVSPAEAGLGNILTFCTADGLETGKVSDNFMTRDTKAMGLIWQKIKGNRNGNYDTFARAMRVGRERQKAFFDYLDGGKGSKKRIYKLGPKCRHELDRMKMVMQSMLR